MTIKCICTKDAITIYKGFSLCKECLVKTLKNEKKNSPYLIDEDRDVEVKERWNKFYNLLIKQVEENFEEGLK